MKKTFKLEINTPCDANLEAMKKTNTGFFCDSCTKNVIDLSNKSNYEISKFITETKDTNICARLKTTQLEEEFSIIETSNPVSSLKYTVAIAASVLLSSNIVAQEKTAPKTEQAPPFKSFALGKMVQKQTVEQTVTFTLKGKIVDSTTKKPITDKSFSTLTISIAGADKIAIVDPETGTFSVLITVPKDTKELDFNYSNNDHYLDKIYKINLKTIRKYTLNHTFSVNPKDFRMLKIAGGMGVIFQNKSTKTNS